MEAQDKIRNYIVINNSSNKDITKNYLEMAWILDNWEAVLKGGDPQVDDTVIKTALSGMSIGPAMWRPLTAGELGRLWRLGKLRIVRYFDENHDVVESELFLVRLARSLGGDMFYYGVDPALKRIVVNNRNPHTTELFSQCVRDIYLHTSAGNNSKSDAD